MSVKLNDIEMIPGDSVSLNIEPYQRIFIRVHLDKRCFVILPLNSGDNIFELKPEGLIKSSEEEYLKSQ